MSGILKDNSFQLSIILTLSFLGVGFTLLHFGFAAYGWAPFIFLPIVLGLSLRALPGSVHLTLLFLLLQCNSPAPKAGGPVDISPQTDAIPVAKGWARNSINAVIFRRNALVTHRDTQYIAFYDSTSHVVLAKRQLEDSTWQIRQTRYRGNTADAHNSISIMVDGKGYLHMAWDHHGDPLRYCRSVRPGALEMSEEMSMTGIREDDVTYPEFYRFSDDDLLFVYRDGASGRGDIMMNYYNTQNQKWSSLQNGFISGERERNAYWQIALDDRDNIHLSWVWRESGDVASNHDLAYAVSSDRGRSWRKSTGEVYELPITAATAEYAMHIPQGSELINQTSMCTDAAGRPYIASYWRPAGTDVPQYQLVYHDGTDWQHTQLSHRSTPFSLSGGGTKRIPISRPKVLIDNREGSKILHLLFRDAERGSRVSLATCTNLEKGNCTIRDLTLSSVAMWEPTYDTELWKNRKLLHIFLQKVEQGDGETQRPLAPQMVSVLEVEGF